MPYVAGVDLGTTFCAAAVSRPDGVGAIDLGVHTSVMPSVVAIRADGEIVTGAAAERRLILEPGRAAREFKRRLGDPTPLLLGGVPYGAETLTGHLLYSIVAAITEREGEPPAVVGLSHPANYGEYKLGLLEEAARVAGITDVVFVPEPVAAAVHYSSTERIGEGALIAVYDLGGGTFDASVVRRVGASFEVVGRPDGIDRFGGIDMDEAVLGHVRDVIGEALLSADQSDPAVISALARLRDECRSAKEILSGDTDVTVSVMLPNLHTDVRLTRAEFEDMIRPRIRDTIGVLQRTVLSAGVEMSDLACVLLVGGSSRIPLVGEMVRQATGRPVGLDTHPKLSVALGTARVALARGAETMPTVAAGSGERGPVAVGAKPMTEPVQGDETPPIDPVPGGVPPLLESRPPEQPAAPKTRSRSRRVSMLVGVTLLAAVAAWLGISVLGGENPSSTVPTTSDSAAPATAETTDEVPAARPVPAVRNSDRVLAFYYTPWETEEFDGAWSVWNDNGSAPPEDISTDYYPSLGPYSTNNQSVIDQHFAWFNQAGIGIVAFDWWGAGSREDGQVSMILDTAERYGLKVIFAINLYGGRSPGNIADSVRYLYEQYGEHPAFYWTDAESPYQGTQAKGVFLLLDPRSGTTATATFEDWAVATEGVHLLPDGGILLAQSTDPEFVVWGGFDGLFNPADPTLEDFGWSTALPDKSWYVPTILPGIEQRKQGTTAGSLPREEGATYSRWWDAALGTGVEPALVAVSSFNGWLDGNQIEPAAPDRSNGIGFQYADYGTLGEQGYLNLTAERVVRLDATPVTEPIPLRMTMTSTSDHATIYFGEGQWLRPTETSFLGAEGDHRAISWDGTGLSATLQQSVETALAGDSVMLEFNVLLIPGESDPSYAVVKGCIGVTTVEVTDLRSGATAPLLSSTLQPSDCEDATPFTIALRDLVGE